MHKEGYYATKDQELEKRMRKNKVFKKDVKEEFIRSSGPGGQNINKVSTCVTLIHVPSGTRVKSQNERTQKSNRHKAWVRLVDKIEKSRKEEESLKKYNSEKKKRQNRKRSNLLKEKVLETKHKQSEKKKARKRINIQNLDQID